jgi:outer membrane receptor protein involved in Fe transport
MWGRFSFFRVLITIFALSSFLAAGVTGKISGRVVDAQTKAGLPGVNVILVNTPYGVATDEEGYFTLINLEPGTYTLELSMIGYATVTARNVVVIMNRTTFLKFALEPEAIQLGTVTVEAKRAIVVPDVSASQLNMQSDMLVGLPVATFAEALGLQAGVEGLTIRGGGQSQTAFLVDGFLLNDERSNNPYTTLSLNSVKELQIQTGGFNAEYGNVRSGVVNVVTSEGSLTAYHGTITLRHSPPAPKHFGESIYSENSYFLRPYLDPAVCWTGTSNGNWDDYTRRQYPSFEGWNTISEATLRDDDPTNDLTPTAAQRIFKWQHRRTGDITKPDYTLDIAFGGPVPAISSMLGNLRFSLTHFSQRNMFVFPLSKDAYTDDLTKIKFTSNVTNQLKLTFIVMTGVQGSVSPYNWKTTPTGSVLNSTYDVANLVNSSSGNAMLYMPGYYSPTNIYRSMVGLKVNHMLNDNLFYELVYQLMRNRYDTYKTRDRNTNELYEIFPGYSVDEAPYGYMGYGVTGIDGMIMGGWMNLGRDKSENTTRLLRFDLTNQVNTHHQIKTGFQFVRNEYRIRSYTENPSMSTWNRSLVYDVSPYRLGVYLQDKLEFEGFIANVGLRWELSSANTEWYALDVYDEYYAQGLGNLIETEAPREPTKPVWTLSPRLGISHPITENSKLYFNYGHFQTEPGSAYRFRLQREANGLVTYIGNPNLTYERTISYELGYSQAMFGNLLFNVAAYYKDVADQPGWVYYQNVNNSIQYRRAANNNYEDIRGIEFTLTKPYGSWITGFLNYTYMVKSSGYFGLTKYYQDPNAQRDYLQSNPQQKRLHPRPYLRVNLDLHTPSRWGPNLMSIYPLSSWRLNLIGTYKTGSYSTYNPDNLPGIIDNVQWKDRYFIDMRLAKKVALKFSTMEIFLDVTNLLNTKFLSYAGFSDYFDYLDYMESLNFPWEEGVEKGNDRVGEYRDWSIPYDPLEPNPDNDPEIAARNAKRKKTKSYIDMPNLKALTFLDPRDITFGITIQF